MNDLPRKMTTRSPRNEAEHILVVEDELHLATGIKFNLEADGYRVTTVGDGPSALSLLSSRETAVDLVILDLMLPGMSGYTVCEEIRKGNTEVPILILSARTLSEDRTRGFDVGADQYLTKPFELDELLSRVRRLIARHGRAANPPMTPVEPPAGSTPAEMVASFDGGRVRVDAARYQVQLGDRTEQLTSREFRLLSYFLSHPERVVSRAELLEEVWEQPRFLQTRAVDQFIRRLRKLIEVNASEPRHIVTVRDAGYRFVPDPSAADKNLAPRDHPCTDIRGG